MQIVFSQTSSEPEGSLDLAGSGRPLSNYSFPSRAEPFGSAFRCHATDFSSDPPKRYCAAQPAVGVQKKPCFTSLLTPVQPIC